MLRADLPQIQPGIDLYIQNCIFCKEQMVELIEMTGEVENPDVRVKNHKTRYGCEFFGEKDIQAAISEIKRATTQYFNP